MKRGKTGLREVVMTWTALITTFFWTSTLRLILKPDISSWRILNIGGKGVEGQVWFLPLVVLFVLFLFYLEGRGKFRYLFYILFLGLHLLFTGVIVHSVFQGDSEISFNSWGIKLPMIWLVLPFVFFLILSVFWIKGELQGKQKVPELGWNQIDINKIMYSAILFPFSVLFFSLGNGFDLMVKLAIIITIFQWLLLTEGLGRQAGA